MMAKTSEASSHLETIAYFSMEIGLDSAMPTYSGGLGVLAGDTLRAAADLAIPMVGVSLLHRKGYFRQHLDAGGNQSESPSDWYPEELLEYKAQMDPWQKRVTNYVGALPYCGRCLTVCCGSGTCGLK